jgi:hypothetical protein
MKSVPHFYHVSASGEIVGGASSVQLPADDQGEWWPTTFIIPEYDPVVTIVRDRFDLDVDIQRKRLVATWVVEPKTAADLLAACHEDRRASYPPIGDQLDAIMLGFRAMIDEGASLPAATVAWVEACEAVKAAHPKPEGGGGDVP